MSNTQGKSRKGLIVGIIAAVAVLAVVLVLLLTQCTGGNTGETTVPPTTEGEKVIGTYDLYWNVDRAQYAGMSEAGMSSRMPEEDGYFHVRFFHDGEIVTLKVADRKIVNALEVRDLMGLTFDENGIVTGVLALEEMPCEQVAWQFYVQSAGGKLIKANSSASLNGMEVLIETGENTGIWDMTGLSGEVGCDADPIPFDRILAVANEAGEVTHIFLYERTNYMRTHEAECEHCGKVVEWSEWTKDTSIPNMTGHFQLMNDITTTGQTSMPEDAKICLDLNGKRIDGKENSRVYSLHNPGTELAIMDTSEEKTGTIAAHGKGDQGMCVWLRYGVVYLYDGILDGSDATSIKNGCTVALQGNTYMYMHGGELIGGTSTYLKNENGSYTNGLGGTLAVGSKAKFVLNDGVIRDGFAEAIVTKRDAKGEPTTYQRGVGGNVFMSSGSVFEMNGGVIKNGKAGNYGGNISLDGTAEFIMNNGSIEGGRINGKGRNGGSIFISSKATFTMNCGRITGGISRNCAGNIYTNGKFTMNGGYVGGGKIVNWTTGKVVPTAASRNIFIVNGQFRMYGGKVDGGVQAIDTDAKKTTTYVSLSGNITIASEVGPNLTISAGGSGVKVKAGNLREKAKIGVNTTVGIFTIPTKEENVDKFYSDIEGAEVVYYQECLALGRFNCLCGEEEHLPGCNGEQLFWAPWTATDKLPTTTGNYYLLNDVTTGQTNIAGDADVKLDLNGHRIDGKTGRIFSMHYRVETDNGDGTMSYSYPAHLTLTDTSEKHDGVIASHGTANHQGSIAWLRYGDVTIITGIYDASDYKLYSNWNAGTDGLFGTADDTITGLAGAAISVPYGRTFTMYGGTIIGGETIAYEHSKTNTLPVPEGSPEGTPAPIEVVKKTVSASHGGALDVTGNVYMYGGTIRDGVSGSTGGNVRINGSGKFYMYGGEIANGTSTGNGGNIQLSGLMELHGGKVIGGWAKNTAGNLHVSPGKLVMSGGYIGGGKSGAAANASADHANIFCVNGKMDLSGGEIAGCVRIIHYNTQGAEGGSVVNISGNPVISTATVDMILAPQGDKADAKPTMPILNVVGPMTEGAMVEVNCATQGIDFAVGDGYTVTAEDAKAFRINGTDIYAAADTENNSLFFGRYNCLCGKDEHTFGCQQVNGGKDLKWFAWTSKTTLPTTGNFYLANDVNGSGSTTVKSGTTLNLDLNGKTVSWKYRAYRIYDASAVANATLTMTNTAENDGTIKAAEFSSSDQGCAVWLAGGEKATFNLLDGVVLDGSNHTISSVPSEKNGAGSTAEKNGGVVAAQSTSTFNMYGGTIIGANAVRSKEITLSNGTKYSAYAPNGGAVSIDGVMNMYGGVIRDGKTANQGGNVLVNGDMFMYGGVISGGHADGNAGNVFVHRNGELHMSGDARIENGTSAAHSGNLNVDGKMTMTDNAVVTGGTAGTGAGNINLNVYITGGVTYTGSLVMSGKASVTDGNANGDGGNIRLLKGASLTMSDETLVSGGVSNKDRGGNISVADTGAVLTMSGKASVIGGKAATNGGNINLSGASTMTATDDVLISGGEVCGVSVGKEPTGGNLGVTGSGAKATLSGNVKILDGISWHTGGNVRISQNATLIVKDNVLIDGGKSSNSKSDKTKALNDTNGNANIFSVNGILEIYGGKITGNINGISTKANGCTVKLSGNAQIPAGGSGYGIHMSVTSTTFQPSMIQVVGAMTGAEDSIVVSNSNVVGTVGSGDGYTLTHEDANVFAVAQKGAAVGCDIILSGNDLVVGGMDCLCGQTEHTKACLELWNGERRLWTPWTSKTSLPTTSGNYYLTGNVDFDWQQKNTKDSNVVIDLNGYTVTNDNGQRMFTNWESGGSLTITDKSDAQTGKLIGSGSAVDQGVIWVRYGTFNLVGGTIDASGFNLKNVWDTAKKIVVEKNGGAIWVSGGASFNMYGGEIIGGNLITSTVTVDGADKNIYAPKGGAICSEGTVNIYDGIIRDGKTVDQGGNIYVRKGTFTMYGGQILGGIANVGGNALIHIDGTMILKEGAVISGGEAVTGTSGNVKVEGKLIVEGGTIQDGVSKGNGGNIQITYTGTVELKSGTISGGWSKNVSGNVHIDAGKFIMTGGTVSGGKTGATAVTNNTHANVQSVNGTWEFLGGTVEGNSMVFNYDVNQTTYPTTVLGGNATHTGNLYLNFTDGKAAPVITVNDDFAGNVVITTKADGIFTANAVTAEQAKCFTSGNSNKNIYRLTSEVEGVAAADEGKLYFGKIGCECGKLGGGHEDFCDGKSYIWTAWSGSSMPSTSGHYYLTGNLSISSSVTLNKVCDIVIDLNGYNISSSAGRMYSMRNTADHAQVKSVLFTNTYNGERSGKRATISVSGSGDQGRIVWLNGEAKTVIGYNFDVDMSKATVSNAKSKDGLAFATTAENGTSNDKADGSYVWATNYIKLYDVKLTGGNTHTNGNLIAGAGATNILLENCYLTSGNASHLDGSTETEFGGMGGAIYMSNNGSLTLTDTVVTGCTATVNGGGVYMGGTSKLTINGNTKITGNTVGGKENNLYIAEGATLLIGSLGSNAQVGLGGVTGDSLSTDATYSDLAAFTADNAEQQLTHMDGVLSLQAASAHIHCVCGGTLTNGEQLPDGTYHYCNDIVYTAMDKTGGDIGADKNWYLADDVALTSQLSTGKYALNLCLNGHNITQTFNQRMIRTYGSSQTNGMIRLTSCVADTVVDGKATNNTIAHKAGTFSDDNDGAIFWITNNGTLEMYAGNLDGSSVTLQPNSSDTPKHGICVKVERGSNFKLYGGTIYGGKTLRGTNNNSEGVTIFSMGNIVINGGKIVGGETVGSGGSLFLFTDSVTKIYGGTITGGKATSNGGNIHFEGKELLIAGGTIEKGNAGKRGGNVWFGVDGGTISGGTITGGNANDGGNVGLNSNKTFTMTGGTITGGNSVAAGGNVWLMGTMKMSGGLIEKGTKAGNANHVGANMNMNSNGVVDMTGGTIKGRVCAAVAGPKLNISGSARIYDTDTTNNLYVWGFTINIGKLNEDAKIGLLILKDDQVGTELTVDSGVTIDPAQFPVHDLELTNSSTRSFTVEQNDTILKIVEAK